MARTVVYWISFLAAALLAGGGVFLLFINTVAEITNLSASYDFSTPVNRLPKPEDVKGLYLTAYSAGDEKKMVEIIRLIDATELNAVVIDIKDYSGQVLYDSKLPFVNDNNLKSARIADLSALAARLHRRGIYAIARVSTFQDPLLARVKPEWAIKSLRAQAQGLEDKLWRDKNGLAWVDPARAEIWDYIVAVAREAARSGFDEINFDYIRYPTDGDLEDVDYGPGAATRAQVIKNFFAYLAEKLALEKVVLSADLFGLTTERAGDDDMNIGQRLGDAARYFDFVCPMVYPSHYPSGYLGFSNPAEHPREVITRSVGSGVRRTRATKAKIRPWLQAFNLGAVYDGDKIRAQIDAAQAAGASGFLLWNARNAYNSEGLLPD